jgi:guanylate kinase
LSKAAKKKAPKKKPARKSARKPAPAKKPVFVVSAPSGTGKTTLNRRLMSTHENIQMSVSYTTRRKRRGEVDGVDYHFVTPEFFREQIKKGQMLEYAEVFGTLYGTPLAEIERIQKLGKVALLEIDVQGWRQAKEKIKNSLSVFILPPSVAALWERLEARGTESKEVRWRRLMTARNEISCGNLYDYFVVNTDLDPAYRELEDIIIKGKNGKIANRGGAALCQKLLQEFDKAPWLQKLSRELADK